MKLHVLGASGRTGQHIVEQALSRGHQVTALVRNHDSIAAQGGLTLVKGTPTNAADLAAAEQGTDAILVALNNPRTSQGNRLNVIE